jgi:hypothetical protein
MENWDCCGRSRRQRIFFSFLTITITITIGRPRCVVNCCMSDHIHIHCGRWIFTLFVFLGSFSALKLSSREVWRAKIPQLLPLTIVIPSNRQVSISLSLSLFLCGVLEQTVHVLDLLRTPTKYCLDLDVLFVVFSEDFVKKNNQFGFSSYF